MILVLYAYLKKTSLATIVRLLIMQGMLAASFSVLAVTTDILDASVLNDTGYDSLMEDINQFSVIAMGISLSLATCDGVEECQPHVGVEELDEIINVLTERIQEILFRQQNGEARFEDIVLAYVDLKEKYEGYRTEFLATYSEDLAEELIDGYDDIFSAFLEGDEELLQDDEDIEGDEEFLQADQATEDSGELLQADQATEDDGELLQDDQATEDSGELLQDDQATEDSGELLQAE